MNERRDTATRLCPVCGGESIVRRGSERDDGVYTRERQCKSCGAVFLTLEVYSGAVKKPKKIKNP